MEQLEHAFKKWEVTEAECQMFVACEAAQKEKHDQNGQLAVDVYNIMM